MAPLISRAAFFFGRMDARSLAGRRAFVTGGAGGIGGTIGRALASGGADVVGADVRTPAEPAEGVEHLRCDVTSAGDVQGIHDTLLAAGRLPDVLVLVAGIGLHERLDEGDPDKWARVFDVNVMGALRPLRAFLPHMAVARRADVVFVSSVAAQAPYAYGGAYSASKAALESVARTLHLESPTSLRVGVVVPGIVDTPFFERTSGHPGLASIGMGALSPDHVAKAVVHMVACPEGVHVQRVVLRPEQQRDDADFDGGAG